MVCIRNICHFSLDKELMAIRASYFLMLGAVGTLNPFLIVFMKVLRMSSLEISIIFGISTALAAPFRIITGYFADKSEKRSLFFFIASFLTGLVTHLIFYIPINEIVTPLNISTNVNWSLCFNTNLQYILYNGDTVISIQDDQPNRPDTISETRINCFNKAFLKNTFIIETSQFKNIHTTNNHTNTFNVVQLKGFINMKLTENSDLSKHCEYYESCNFNNLHSGIFSKTFIYSFLLVCLCIFTYGPLQNILDSLIYTHLHQKKEMSNFGRSRLFGTIGYGLFALVAGFVMDLLRTQGYTERNTYFFTFFSYAIIITLSGVNLVLFVKNKATSSIPNGKKKDERQNIKLMEIEDRNIEIYSINSESSASNNDNYNDGLVIEKVVLVDGSGENQVEKTKDNADKTTQKYSNLTINKAFNKQSIITDINKEKSTDMDTNKDTYTSKNTIGPPQDDSRISWRDFPRVVSQFYMIVLILSSLIAGTLSGCNEGFFFYFLYSLDPNNKRVMGLSLAFSSLGEIIVLFFSGKVTLMMGRKNCLYLVFIVYALRYLANSFLNNVWFAVFTEFSHSLCFGLFYPVVSEWASSLTPLALQSTTQCYIGSVYFSLGRATGLGIGGVMYSVLGPRLLFRMFACMSALYTMCLLLLFKVFDVWRKKQVVGKEVTI